MFLTNLFQSKPKFLKIYPDYATETIEVAAGKMDSCVITLDILKNYHVGGEPFVVYSAGIGNQINFELELMDLLQNKEVSCELFAIDPTPKSLEFLNKQDLPQNFHVLPYALAASDCEIKFKLPKRKGWISGTAIDATQDSRRLDMKNSVNVKGRSIKSLMTELRHTHIDLLKMDIEGSEFDVLESVLLDDSIVIRELCFDHHEGMLKGDGVVE